MLKEFQKRQELSKKKRYLRKPILLLIFLQRRVRIQRKSTKPQIKRYWYRRNPL
ncbi:uncharacterized protein DS421_6g191830 [Arachis hypogaea]|nr:uncharacterized protein DS421_6g191830 [Arachis hypogaea]